jgi:CheY-like chemotaxis protein
MADLDDDDELLTDDPALDAIGGPGPAPPWLILAVDDDAGVRAVSAAAPSEVRFRDRPLVQLHAASAADAREILARQPGIAVMLLDVVMETEDSGLQLVRYVREVLGNRNLRIILRTGQPGAAPESDVIFTTSTTTRSRPS